MKPKEFGACSDNDKIWYLDNGVSNHMTSKCYYLKNIDETITWKLIFGDDSIIGIKGK